MKNARAPRRRNGWITRSVAGLAAAMAIGTSAVVMAGPASAAAGAFPSDPPLVFVGQDDPTGLYTAVQGAGAVEFRHEGGVSSYGYNAIGYRESDGYVYGMRRSTATAEKNQLVRVGQGGEVTVLGAVSGLYPLADGTLQYWNQGTVGDGQFADTLFVRAWVRVEEQPTHPVMKQLYAVDINTRTARVIELDEQVPDLSDIVFKDGFVWGQKGLDTSSAFYRIDPVSGHVDVFDVTHSLGLLGATGGQWVYGNGNIGLSRNWDGTVHQIAIDDPASANPTFRLISQQAGPASSNNDAAAMPGQPVDLGIVKSAPATFTSGDPVTFTLTVTNHGPGTSSGFVVRDALPAQLSNVTSVTPGCTVNGNVLTCTGGVLASGQNAVIQVTGTTTADFDGCIDNTGTVLGNEEDPSSANNSSTARTCGEPVPVNPTTDLELVKSAPATMATGDTLTYTFTVTNKGASDSTGYTVTDNLPAELTDVTAVSPECTIDGGSVTCVGGALAVGQSREFSITAKVPAEFVGCVENTASVVGNEADPNAINDTSSVNTCVEAPVCPPDALSAVDDQAVAKRGETVDIDVLANDRKPAAAEPHIVAGPEHGWVRINADGTVTYLADASYTGTDTFEYTIHVDGCESTTAIVTIGITDDEIPPIPVADPAALASVGLLGLAGLGLGVHRRRRQAIAA
ncbi:DUF6923 family protein [Cellulosimicrobium cellulans]|nr:Ig-like domain-containing protein [Cellulosimicrobium cellulans]